MTKRLLGVCLWVVIGLVLSGSVWGVNTVYVEHNSEEQFTEGEPNKVLISSEGEISLGYEVETLLTDSNDVWVINALAEGDDGSLYAASSGAGYVHRWRAGSTDGEIIYGKGDDDARHVFSLAVDRDGMLLAGTGGESGQLLRLDGQGGKEVLWADEQVKYIWSIVVGPAGRIYLGTGPGGKVMTLGPDGGNAEVLYQASEKNILCLALDADGMLYAGGDEHGLVYRVDPGSKIATIVYDCGHGEISSLVFDEVGNLYASTADATAARPGAKLVLSDGRDGRPGGDDGGDADDTAEAQGGERGQAMAAGESGGGGRAEPTGRFGPSGGKRGKAKVNDVYKITPGGYVVKLFSKPVVILQMAHQGEGELLLATGNSGQLLRLNVDRREAVVLSESESSVQVSAVLVGRDARVYAGLANPGGVIAVGPAYGQSGEYVSGAVDAEQISRWGRLQIDADVPAGTGLQISTRSGNTADADKGGWGQWTAGSSLREDVPAVLGAGRFLQYRLGFSSVDGAATPVVKGVKLVHTAANLPPRVEAVGVMTAGEGKENGLESGPGGSKVISVKWKAADDNEDDLVYDVFVRQIGRERWVRIAEELGKNSLKWDSQTAADGRYEIKVVASDAPSNAVGQQLSGSRVSRVLLVDNTPPEVPELSYDVVGSSVRFRAVIADQLSAVGGVSYCVNSAEDWQVVLPGDGVFDSRSEQVAFEFEADDPGEQMVAVRFEDALGNRVYRNVSVIVE